MYYIHRHRVDPQSKVGTARARVEDSVILGTNCGDWPSKNNVARIGKLGYEDLHINRRGTDQVHWAEQGNY